MNITILKDTRGVAYDAAIELPHEELEKRHQTRIVEITVKMPDGRFARAFVHAASGRNGVQFELTCLTNRSKESKARAVANFRKPRLTTAQEIMKEEDEKVWKDFKSLEKKR